MADPRFFKKKGPFPLATLADIGQCLEVRGNPLLSIEDVASLEKATDKDISFFAHVRHTHDLQNTKASACILTPEMASKAPPHLTLLITKHPSRSYGLIAKAFYPQESPEERIDPTALIHPEAKLGKGVSVGPYSVIGAHVELGDHVHIGTHVVIREGVIIGDNSIIDDQVLISHALIGKRVHIKPGARIGQSGFGFFMDEGDTGGHVTIPQLGRVLIHDDVEIGSNTTVDRGSNADTVIGTGTRIDNLVQIAHNVHFGKGCVMVAQVGVSGSTKFGDYVAAGGQAGITGHLTIGSYARLGAQCGIMRNVEAGEILAGSPAMPLKAHYRQVAVLKRLEETSRKNVKHGK